MTTENCRKRGNEAGMENPGQNPKGSPESANVDKAKRGESFLLNRNKPSYISKIEDVVNSANMENAIKAVKRNKGAPGGDGITVEEIEDIVEKDWPTIKQEILEDRCYPAPVRGVKSRNQMGVGFDNWESQQCWIELSNRQSIRWLIMR